MDRAEIQYGVKELCASMSRPTQRSWRQLKQLERYLVGKADMTWEYEAGARTDMMARIGPETGSSAKAHPEAW